MIATMGPGASVRRWSSTSAKLEPKVLVRHTRDWEIGRSAWAAPMMLTEIAEVASPVSMEGRAHLSEHPLAQLRSPVCAWHAGANRPFPDPKAMVRCRRVQAGHCMEPPHRSSFCWGPKSLASSVPTNPWQEPIEINGVTREERRDSETYLDRQAVRERRSG